MKLEQIIFLLFIGLTAGFISGLAGVGGGIIMVPFLIVFLGMTQHQAQGTSLATLVFPIGIMAAFNYYKEGFVNWKFVVFLAIAFVFGGYLGSKLAISLNQKLLKRIFATILIFSALKMYYDSFK